MLAEKCINIPPSPDVCVKDFSHAWKKVFLSNQLKPYTRYNIPCSPKTPSDFNLASGYIRNVGSSPYFGSSEGHRNSLNVALLQYLEFNAFHGKRGGVICLFVCFYRRKEKTNSLYGTRLLQPLGPPGFWE